MVFIYTYLLPIGWLYATYHLLREPGNSIDATYELPKLYYLFLDETEEQVDQVVPSALYGGLAPQRCEAEFDKNRETLKKEQKHQLHAACLKQATPPGSLKTYIAPENFSTP